MLIFTRSQAGPSVSGFWLLCACALWPTFLSAQSLAAIFVAEQQAVLSAERSTRLLELRVKPGDQVEAGELLAVFDTSDIDRDLKIQQAKHRYLLAEVKAAQRLLKQGMTNAAELAERERDAAIAEANIQWLSQQQARGRLRAPFAGTVIELGASAHEWMQAGQALLKLLATDNLSLSTSVSEAQAQQLKLGQQLLLTIPALQTTARATVEAILPEVDVQSATVVLRLRPQLSEALSASVFAGMRAELSLDTPPVSLQKPLVQRSLLNE